MGNRAQQFARCAAAGRRNCRIKADRAGCRTAADGTCQVSEACGWAQRWNNIHVMEGDVRSISRGIEMSVVSTFGTDVGVN